MQQKTDTQSVKTDLASGRRWLAGETRSQHNNNSYNLYWLKKGLHGR